MHLNAEIWEKRHERLQAIRASAVHNFNDATRGHSEGMMRGARRQWSRWEQRYNLLERRVWNALCVAKGWRKA